MNAKTKAARSSGNYSRANVHMQRDSNIVQHDYEFGSLVFGVIFAVSFGLMFIHWAVM